MCRTIANDEYFGVTEDENAVMYLFETLIYRLLLQGILQPFAALFAALIALPFASALIILCKSLLSFFGSPLCLLQVLSLSSLTSCCSLLFLIILCKPSLLSFFPHQIYYHTFSVFSYSSLSSLVIFSLFSVIPA